MLRNNMIQNFPIAPYDFTNTHTMFGPNLADTGGNTVQHNTYSVVMDYVDLPRDVF